MNLHLAVDLASLGPALELAWPIHDLFDSIWLSPPLIKNEGLRAAEAFKSNFSHKYLVADMRGAESAAIEATLAFGAKADMMTVLAAAPDTAIQETLKTARRLPIRLAANLNGCADLENRARHLASFGLNSFTLHPETDRQWRFAGEFARELESAGGFVYVAGCNGTDFLKRAADCGICDALVGPLVYMTHDPDEAARRLHGFAKSL